MSTRPEVAALAPRMPRRARPRPVPRVVVYFALALLTACGLGDLLSPRDGLVHLTLAPADTTLGTLGDSVCFRWTALGATGDSVPGLTPAFALADTASSVAFAATPSCVVAVKRGSPSEVRARLDTVTATAIVRVKTGGPPGQQPAAQP